MKPMQKQENRMLHSADFFATVAQIFRHENPQIQQVFQIIDTSYPQD